MKVLAKIQTGCRRIDQILEGGVPSGSISLIYGEAETGKSTLAMQCAVNCARQGYKTLFIDCDDTFSARRLSQIASEDFSKIAELIILMKPHNFREQTTVIDRLPDYIAKNFGLIVVDTITTLYRVKVAESPDKTFELNRELNRQIAFLAQIAKIQRIAILTTSQVQSVFNETFVSVAPVATRVLKFWADTIIAMQPTGNPQIIKAIIEKTLEKKDFQSFTCLLKLEESGIHEHSSH